MENTLDIIKEFELLVGDETELSIEEELRLLNRIYSSILHQKDWEFLKKEASGILSGTEIEKPSDFSSLVKKEIYIGNNPSQVVPFDERRLYKTQNHYAYYDARQGKFVFFKEQSGDYSFDYFFVPPQVNITTPPVFPNRYWPMISYLMASENDIIQMSDKARSYATENRQKGQALLDDMKMWNETLTGYETYGN